VHKLQFFYIFICCFITWYQEGKTNLDLLEQEILSGSAISWATCKSAPLTQIHNHASIPPLSFLQAGCPSCRPTNSVKALKAKNSSGHHFLKTRLAERGEQVIIRPVCATYLKFFSHTAYAHPTMDHSRAIWAHVAPLPRKWNHWSGRPCHTWLRTIELDLALLNNGLATACHRGQRQLQDKPHDDDEDW